MGEPIETQLTGLDYLRTVTELLQRRRSAHPTRGLYEAGELNFWWRVERQTDDLPQLFWLDDDGRPAAGVLAIDFGGGNSGLYQDTTLVFLLLPDADAAWIDHVVDRALAHYGELGIGAMDLEIGRSETLLRATLERHGFELREEDALVEAWLNAADRPEVSPLHDGYRLASRSEVQHLTHHMTLRHGEDMEPRLNETPLYRAELDLVVLTDDDDAAGYGMFWFDPVTRTGAVEPMRTMDDHQQKGLARHILTAGVNALAEAGAERISIGYEPANPASGHLYRSVGFVPGETTDMFNRPAPTSA